jgi:hypothetical protein
MLFKTPSASVYGIDAYLVQVEVDVGSAEMNQFNVVGLSDNAVKESRERIKAALKNCGFAFPARDQGDAVSAQALYVTRLCWRRSAGERRKFDWQESQRALRVPG